MDVYSNDLDLIRQIQCLEPQYLSALGSGVEACESFVVHLKNTLAHARDIVNTRAAPCAVAQALSNACESLNIIPRALMGVELRSGSENQFKSAEDMFIRANFRRRRRKRSTRSRKSKAGKSGRVRHSGKKSKRGRKSPVGNPKRRVQLEVEGEASTSTNPGAQPKRQPTALDSNGRKCRTVTAPPTDSMKFGPCRDFFLSHLGDPYPTTVQKHQILKQSSPDFTLRSLNLWFVNIRRRSKWMDIFKKHAGSKREAMRDLVARVEAQVAGRPAPNPLPSGATPPGFKVEGEIVEEVMAMRAVVDMVSREVYGEGWDQILQIKPWTDEEVRAHEERKKMSRREARAAKADGEKRKRERDEQRDQRKRDKESRKRVEQEAVESIRAARELHVRLMSMNKRKRDEDESLESPAKRSRKGKEVQLDENGHPKKVKVRVPKVDEHGNSLTKEQRKALKKAILAARAQANPLKRKSPEPSESNGGYPNIAGEVHAFDDLVPSKRRRRDAATFDGFPSSEDPTEGTGMTDLSQLFSLDWASPPAPTTPLPIEDSTPSPVSNTGYGEFAHPSGAQPGPMAVPVPIVASVAPTAGEVPRRFSQQLAAYALESGMFDGDNFELFTEDTFPGITVDVNPAAGMRSLMPPHPDQAMGPMSVSSAQTESHTPTPSFAAPVEMQGYDTFAQVHPHERTPPSPYSAASTVTPTNGHADMDTDMSWINAAIAQLPSEHDVQQRMNDQYHHASGSQETVQHAATQPGYNQAYTDSDSYAPPLFPPASERRAPVSHQRTQVTYPSPQPQHNMPPPPPPSTTPSHLRRPFPHPQGRSSAPPPSFHPPPQPQQRQRPSGGLWQTPYSQPAQQQYQQPTTSFPSPAASRSPSRSFPAPAQPHHSDQSQHGDPNYERHHAYTQSGSSSPERGGSEHGYQQHTPIYPQQQYPPTVADSVPSPVATASEMLKQRELEFARAQEELQNRFKREQEEQLARFMQSQEDLRKQMLNESGRP